MKDKENVNISTKEEIRIRNKRVKERGILANALYHYANNELSYGIKNIVDCESCANYLFENLGYRKIPEGSVVLSKGEAQKYYAYKHIEPQIKGCLDREVKLEKQLKEARKETAREILQKLYDETIREGRPAVYKLLSPKDIKELAKQYGVEVEE